MKNIVQVGEVKQITIKHKGFGWTYRRIMPPEYTTKPFESDDERGLEIEIRDISELDEIIDILKDVKMKLRNCAGAWQPKMLKRNEILPQEKRR